MSEKASASQARTVTTNQQGVHEKLDALVKRYQSSVTQRPISAHTQAAFDQADAWLDGWKGEVILDACCGVGESTAWLARQYPEAKVIGIDKSALRVGKHGHYAAQDDNYCVIRADLNDFWRLVKTSSWNVSRQFILYPNPYPKNAQVQKRWHASAAMPDIMAISSHLEVRSNWLTYLAEFAQAASHYGLNGTLAQVPEGHAITPFERKYMASGQPCWRLLLAPEEES